MADTVGLPPGDKVLVVGSLMHRAWEPYRTHPQVLFWTGGRPEIRRRLKRNGHATFLPIGVKLILMSRFLGHAETDPIKKEAKRYGPEVICPLEDGDITRRLAQLIPSLPEPEPVPSSATVVEDFNPVEGMEAQDPLTGLRPFNRDEQRAFLQQHYDPHASSVVAEANRLVGVARADGIGTTVKALYQGLVRLRQDLGLVKSRTKTIRPDPPPLPVLVDDAPQGHAPSMTDDGLIKVIDDVIAGLTLVREELRHARRDREELRALKAKLAELLT